MIAYCLMMSHPLNVFDTAMEDFYHNLDTSRCFILYSIVLHFSESLLKSYFIMEI